MSIQPVPIDPVPDETRRVARATFPKGNPYLPCATNWAPSFRTTTLLISTRTPASPACRRGAWPG